MMVHRGDVSKRRGSCINEQRRAEQQSTAAFHSTETNKGQTELNRLEEQ